MLTLPNLERLKIFHLVYLNRSIQRAAALVGLTRSAVSQSLKALEHELGIELFIRDSKKFQPTAAAEELFRTVDPFVVELKERLRDIESGQKSVSGHLRVGAPLDFGSQHLTQVMGRFKKKFPDLSFELSLAVPIKLLESLCRGELDMAFIDNGDVHAPRFPVTLQHVIKEEFVLAASPKNWERFGLRNASMTSLSKAEFVDYLPSAPVVRMWLKHHFGKAPLALDLRYSAESVQGVLRAIKCDIGIGVVPARLIVGEYKGLLVVSTHKKPFVNQIMIARQEGKKATAKEKAFIEFYKENGL